MPGLMTTFPQAAKMLADIFVDKMFLSSHT